MNEELEALKAEADTLGIKYSPNIGASKLQEKIDNAQGTAVTLKPEVPTSVTKEEFEKEVNKLETVASTKKRTMKQKADEAEALARVTHIIIITDNDQRENSHTTTVAVNCGNSWFDLGTRIIPLNEEVEVEQGYIQVLKEIKIPLHLNTADGKGRTVMRNRYSISYSDELKKD